MDGSIPACEGTQGTQTLF